MKLFGILGFPLGHSFSKGYFTEKFEKLGISNSHKYEKFEVQNIASINEILAENPDIVGFNVTIPHKKNVIEFLQSLDGSAQKVGAVNVIKKMEDGTLKGFNSDYYGFKNSLEDWFKAAGNVPNKALVLGNGGAAQAVKAALNDLNIGFLTVTRKANEGDLQYEQLTEAIMANHELIINTTPQGTFPKVDEKPQIPYEMLSEKHFLYDLVYNPAETAFMHAGAQKGAYTHNGLAMLHLQAEKAWEIWNS